MPTKPQEEEGFEVASSTSLGDSLNESKKSSAEASKTVKNSMKNVASDATSTSLGDSLNESMNASAKASKIVKNSMKNAASDATKTVKKFVTSADDELSWEQLKSIEKRRRAILERTELPFFRTLLFWDGTVLQALFTDPLMWMCMLLYTGVRIGARYGLPSFFSDLGGADIGTIGAFLSFFLVFYVVACNKRFDLEYKASMECQKQIFNAAGTARAIMPRENALRFIRYMNAMHVAGYVGLSSTYTFDNFFLPLNERNGFITDEECERIREIDMDIGGSSCRELVTWCLADVITAYEAKFIDNRQRGLLFSFVNKAREAIDELYDFDDQPVSFFYLHFINLLTAMYLPLYAISAALDAGTGDEAYWLNDVISGLIVFLQCTFVIGLRILAQKMNDPYGDDLEDLSVMHYVNFTWLMSRRMLDAQLRGPVDGPLEEKIANTTRSVGEAWGNHSTAATFSDDSELDE